MRLHNYSYDRAFHWEGKRVYRNVDLVMVRFVVDLTDESAFGGVDERNPVYQFKCFYEHKGEAVFRELIKV